MAFFVTADNCDLSPSGKGLRSCHSSILSLSSQHLLLSSQCVTLVYFMMMS
ncbi:hypothetical protein ACJZL1_04270 [Wolbachia endosymbiont of Rhagoletis indifferens]|uniref:hypothetical protein n=1 Tax=Wolbachia endosymbiont of Rhagoletis indifferens TaxID=3383250 RepID=UPI003AF33D61